MMKYNLKQINLSSYVQPNKDDLIEMDKLVEMDMLVEKVDSR